MAYTKVKPVHTNLGRCIDYTTNPKKTEHIGADIGKVLGYTQNAAKTEYQFYVKAYNCTAENAQQAMMQTKHRYAKDGKNHVLAYHLIQSFSPGEVTPEQAHQIGCKFVERYLANQYEVTISTHLDRKHLHNHVVFNSVSFVDGTMFRNSYADYFSGIRKISDEVCREYGLSMIDPERKGKAYNEWQAERQGQPTMRGSIRADVDEVLEKSINWQTFVIGMKKLGYEVKFGAKQKYATVKHIKGSRAIRLKSLGEEYTEKAIRQRFIQRGYEPIPQGGEAPKWNCQYQFSHSRKEISVLLFG